MSLRAQTGRLDEALETVERIRYAGTRAAALRAVARAQAQAQAGLSDGLEAWIQRRADPRERVAAWLGIAEGRMATNPTRP